MSVVEMKLQHTEQGPRRSWAGLFNRNQHSVGNANTSLSPGHAAAANTPSVALQGVSKSYQLGVVTVEALRKVDLVIKRGEMAAVWGPSGSGKSTLLNLVGLADRPSHGRVILSGIDTTSLGETAAAAFRNRYIGYVFQSFNLIPVLSVLENVMLPLEISGARADQTRKRAKAMLDEVGLIEKCNVRPDELSGGQRQRVAIARALVTEPALVIADEPTANLDSETSERVLELMQRLNLMHSTTFLISTHDPRVLRYVTRRIQLKDGSIVEE